jgi:hypothetical protein
LTGVMSGDLVLDYVLLHKGALELEAGLRDWLAKTWDQERGKLSFLTPNDWFAHAANVAAEQMARRIHQRPGSCHMPVALRLMTA